VHFQRVASSSAVSVQGYSNLASTVDMSIGSHDKSANVKSKFSDESAVAADENNIDAETTTDEETQDDSTDEDNNNASADTEFSDKDIEDKSDLSEDSAKQNSKNEDNLSVDNNKKQNVKKGNGVETVKGFAIAGTGAIMVGSATSVISKLVKSSGDEKKEEKDPSEKLKYKGSFVEWCKNNLLISLLVTYFVGSIVLYIISFLRNFCFNLCRRVKKRNNYEYIGEQLGFEEKIYNQQDSVNL
jgi:hypothetical protein